MPSCVPMAFAFDASETEKAHNQNQIAYWKLVSTAQSLKSA